MNTLTLFILFDPACLLQSDPTCNFLHWDGMTDESNAIANAGATASRDDVELVAYAPSSLRLAELARRVALSDCTVLIVCESFRALTEVHNRLVNAYQEIMNMPI